MISAHKDSELGLAMRDAGVDIVPRDGTYVIVPPWVMALHNVHSTFSAEFERLLKLGEHDPEVQRTLAFDALRNPRPRNLR